MKSYTVRQVAKMAGVTVRTLHHYDQIGLLRPERRSQSRYRRYGEADLLRLQQILFYRQMDLSLKEIQLILDRPDFDPLTALREHRHRLQAQVERLQRLLMTIDRTISRLSEENMEMSDAELDAELYEGFTPQQAERYPREARQLYGEEIVSATEQRLRKLSKAEWQAVKEEGGAIAQQMSELMVRPVSDPQVQAVIARHHAWIENFYPAPEERYRGLGNLYTENEEFRAFYDRYRPGLADFFKAAMEYYCDHSLSGK